MPADGLTEPGLDGGRQRAALRQPAGHPHGVGVRLVVHHAVGAPDQVQFELVPLRLDQVALGVVGHPVDQLVARHVAIPPSKCGARASRIRSLARCSRLLTAGTLSPRMSAISAFGNPSTSASTYTSRNGSGSVPMAFSITALCSASSTG